MKIRRTKWHRWMIFHPLLHLLLRTWTHREVDCIWTRFELVRPHPAWGTDGTTPYIKINAVHSNGPNVTADANFGCSVAMIGDLDNNGWDDIAVGASGENWLHEEGVYERTGSVYM